jgi:hypothetical protein
MPDEYLASLSVERRADMWRRTLAEPTADRVSRFAAEDAGGTVVGFASVGVCVSWHHGRWVEEALMILQR